MVGSWRRKAKGERRESDWQFEQKGCAFVSQMVLVGAHRCLSDSFVRDRHIGHRHSVGGPFNRASFRIRGAKCLKKSADSAAAPAQPVNLVIGTWLVGLAVGRLSHLWNRASAKEH